MCWVEVSGLSDCSESEECGNNILKDNRKLREKLLLDARDFLCRQKVGYKGPKEVDWTKIRKIEDYDINKRHSENN